MKIKKSELKAVAVKPHQYPEDDMPEVAFAGRSNVGKSSLINLLLNRKKLARVSGNPGKTRTINFYEINDTFRIVDLPGYGYARVSKSVTENWGQMIETYLAGRQELRAVIQLVDIRHVPTAQDIQMYEWLRHYGLDGIVAATKADKISRNELQRNIAIIRKTLGLSSEDIIIPVSTLKRTGTDELLDVLDQLVTAEADEDADAGEDADADAGTDARENAGAGVDARENADEDADADAGEDADADAGEDADADAGEDADADAGADARENAGAGVDEDAGSDAGADAGADAGEGGEGTASDQQNSRRSE